MDLNFSSTVILVNLDFYKGTQADFNFENIYTADISYNFDFNSTSKVFFVLRSKSNSFNSIWCDANASLTNGRFYVGSEKDLTIVSNRNSQAYIENFVSKTVLGSTNEVLAHEGIVDITVGYGSGSTASIASLEKHVRVTFDGKYRTTADGKIRK